MIPLAEILFQVCADEQKGKLCALISVNAGGVICSTDIIVNFLFKQVVCHSMAYRLLCFYTCMSAILFIVL